MSDPKISDLLAKAKELGVNDEATARGLIKTNKVRSFKRLAEVISKLKPSAARMRVRKATKIHAEGPRGFKLGPVWLGSIRTQKGIALSPSNLPKLQKTAAQYGVDGTQEQSAIVAALAKLV